jgi:hypothetical protein
VGIRKVRKVVKNVYILIQRKRGIEIGRDRFMRSFLFRRKSMGKYLRILGLLILGG